MPLESMTQTTTKHPNPDLELVDEFIRETGCNIYLTGKAGTGKTTFLRTLNKRAQKQHIITAPTGVAAINAGGVTLHSFFQLPFGPFIPGTESTRSQYRYSKEKINIIKSLDLLVIDEISMVRADLLDGVDSIMRRFRRNNAPFGGVQLLMIGDLFQLPPVVKDNEWRLLKAHYASPYFFNSLALGKKELLTIELKHIYRQADEHFIDLLNRVRNNRMSPSTLDELNRRVLPGFVPQEGDGYITLCTHNNKANIINQERLAALSQKSQSFQAEIEGDFPEHTYPTSPSLDLKEGAQVMFVRNDPSPEKRFFNGKIGTITQLSKTTITIQCPGDREEIIVEKVTWENIEYSLNKETLEISENKAGTFTQYPLRLAWAITIHKSQGLTFDRAIIDAQAAFAHGQVYVALSRCRTFEGMVLTTPLVQNALKTDTNVITFNNWARQNAPTKNQLEMEKIFFQQKLLMECFDFKKLGFLLNRLVSLVRGNGDLIHISGTTDLGEMKTTTEQEICTVGTNFQNQLHGLFSESTLPSTSPPILERIRRASEYFQQKFTTNLEQPLSFLELTTDNKELRKNIRNRLQFLREEVAVKHASVQCCANGFSPSDYFRAISTAGIRASSQKKMASAPTYSEEDITHPDFFQILKEWRSRKAQAQGIAHYQVLHQKTLIQIVINLPETIAALMEIKGIGAKLTERYGDELISLVSNYRSANNIKEVTLPTTKNTPSHDTEQKGPKINTKQLSFDLFKKDLSLQEIAEKRGLVLSTIESHLAYFVETGELSINALLSTEKQQQIQSNISQNPSQSLSEIKKNLNTDISYGDIKLFLAHLKYSH